MKNAKQILTDQNRKQIEETIEKAERKTAAEFVCAIATESDRYDRAESLAGLFFGLLFLGAANAYGGYQATSVGSWEVFQGIHYGWQVLSVVGGYLFGTVLTSYVHPIRNLFVSETHLNEAVEDSAAEVFHEYNLRSTKRDSGVLIYVSLFERRVRILTDENAGDALEEGNIEKLRDTAVEHLKQGNFEKAFTETIRQAAEMCTEELPAGEKAPDNLENQVLTFHPRPR